MPRTPQEKRPSPMSVGRLRLRVVRGPDKTNSEKWYWRICEKGTGGRTLTCGWFTADEASQRAAQILAGIEPKPDNLYRPNTVHELLDLWWSEQAFRPDLAEATVKARLNAVARIRRYLGPLPIHHIDHRQLELFRNRRRQEQNQRTGRGGAPSTIRLDLKVLRKAWKWGQVRNYIHFGLPRIRVGEKRRVNCHRTPTVEEAQNVLDALAGWHKICFGLLFFTGARIGTIARLRWKDVDLDQGQLHLMGKGQRPRVIPIPVPLGRLLQEWKQRRHVHPDQRISGVSEQTVKSALPDKMVQVCGEFGIPRFTPHGLRRLRAREFRRAGVPVRTAADYLGHSPQEMLRVYDGSSPDDLRTAVSMCWGSS